jgi:ankyrin repeat protein
VCTQEIEYLFPPLTFLQLEGTEQIEVTALGPIRLLTVRANVNQRAMTCEMIVGLKRQLHIDGFDFALQALRGKMMDSAQRKRFSERFAKDTCSSWLQYKDWTIENFANKILDECNDYLRKHKEITAEEMLDDGVYRMLVHEMLSSLQMGWSKLELYLKDGSRYMSVMENMRIRAAHRERVARHYKQLAESKHLEKTSSGAESETTVKKAIQLCIEEGLLKESVQDQNELGETKIMEAAADDWKQSHIRLLIDARACVNETKSDGTTATMLAAQCGHTATVKVLHALGADVRAADNNGVTAAIWASRGGHTATVKELHALGADVRAADNDGATAVIDAAEGGHTATVKQLYALGADVKAADNEGWTAVMSAAAGGHTATVRQLYALGADVKAVDNDGASAVMLAAGGGYTAMVKVLHALGADIRAADNDGWTAVMSAAGGGHTATVTELHALGADVRAADNDGWTAVMAAAQAGHTATVKELHALGADVRAADNDGWTAVMAAAQAGHTATVTELHALGADVRAADKDGVAAVMDAAELGHTATGKEHSLGAGVKAQSKGGNTAVEFVVQAGHPDTIAEYASRYYRFTKATFIERVGT